MYAVAQEHACIAQRDALMRGRILGVHAGISRSYRDRGVELVHCGQYAEGRYLTGSRVFRRDVFNLHRERGAVAFHGDDVLIALCSRYSPRH
jgi:hypothetical protein